MSITRTRFATQARTWVIISALSALFVGLGYLFGGSSGLHPLRRHRGRLQPRHVLVLGQARAQGEQGPSRRPERGARALPRHRGDRRQGRRADAARLPDPVRAAERVRDRPQPEEGGRRGHGGPAPLPAARAGERRARARDGAHRQPRHPRDDDRRHDRRRDRGDREHPPVLDVLRRRTTRTTTRSGSSACSSRSSSRRSPR